MAADSNMKNLQVTTFCILDCCRISDQEIYLERNLATLVQVNQAAVDGQRGAAGRKTQDIVRFLDRRLERLDSRNNVVGDLLSV